jgi:hypothetical protein
VTSRAAGNRKASSVLPVVVGVADHNGWAILVSVAALNGQPAVVDRRRVPLVEKGVPSQPYHHETLALRDDAAEQLLRQVKRSIDACTTLALDRLSADLRPRYRVSSLAIRHPPLPRLPATVAEVHGSYYTLCRADGMLYHLAICSAARRRHWKVQFHHRGEELAKAAEALQASSDEVERFLGDFRQTLKPPWTAEHRHSFAAAIGTLRTHSRLVGLRTNPMAAKPDRVRSRTSRD